MARITAALLDRDGTVIIDKHYLSDPDGVELLPHAAEGLRLLSASGVALFLVTNQSGIGRGYFTPEAYQRCHTRLVELLRAEGVTLADAVFCPHAPETACECRKPALGMWRTLCERHALDPAYCAMIGDKKEDIAFGLAAGFAATVLVLTGKGSSAAETIGLPPLSPSGRCVSLSERQAQWPHAVACDLSAAAHWLLLSDACEK